MPSALRFACWGFLAALFLLTPSPATVLQPLSVADLAGHADVVIRGRLSRVQAMRGPGAMPVTVADVEVLEVMAGNLPPRRFVRLTQPGGQVDGVQLDYAGRPQLIDGQESVFFLHRQEPGRFIIVGLAQGKFDVTGGDGDIRRPLRRNLHGADFAAGTGPTPPADLEQLRQRLAALPRNTSGSR